MSFPDTLKVLRKHSLPSLVQEELERMILDGRLLPGEALRELSLSALMGVSRGPIREAFRALEEKGLVRVVKNCGVYVRTLDLEEADQIYEVRVVLEASIGEKVALAVNARGLAELDAIVEDMDAAVTACDINRYTALNLAFHDRLAALTGNRKLHETYGRLVSELSLFRRQTYVHDENSLVLSLAEHKAILAAVSQRQPQRAAQLLQRHAADSRARMHKALSGSLPALPLSGD